MSNNPSQPNIARIRQLLLAAFAPEELRRFCYDHPTFRPVLYESSPGDGLTDLVDELIIRCKTYHRFPDLLAELRQLNPGQYARFIEPDQAQDGPARPTPEIVTITRPFRLDLVRIPAGEFRMGSVIARDKYAREEELPPHRRPCLNRLNR